jgi:hypothetical protein
MTYHEMIVDVDRNRNFMSVLKQARMNYQLQTVVNIVNVVRPGQLRGEEPI